MPFFDDAGIAQENHRGPIIGALAGFGEQVERMVAVNIAWSATLLPAMLAMAFPGLPAAVRIALGGVSSILVVPATGAMFALAARALDGEQLSLSMAREALRETTANALKALTPLFALLGVLVWAGIVTGAVGFIPGEVITRAATLILLVLATFWGPVLIGEHLSAAGVLRRSTQLFWQRPGATLKTCVAVLVIAALSALTVAGAVLAAPMAIALLHTNLYRELEGSV